LALLEKTGGYLIKEKTKIIILLVIIAAMLFAFFYVLEPILESMSFSGETKNFGRNINLIKNSNNCIKGEYSHVRAVTNIDRRIEYEIHFKIVCDSNGFALVTNDFKPKKVNTPLDYDINLENGNYVIDLNTENKIGAFSVYFEEDLSDLEYFYNSYTFSFTAFDNANAPKIQSFAIWYSPSVYECQSCVQGELDKIILASQIRRHNGEKIELKLNSSDISVWFNFKNRIFERIRESILLLIAGLISVILSFIILDMLKNVLNEKTEVKEICLTPSTQRIHTTHCKKIGKKFIKLDETSINKKNFKKCKICRIL